VIDSQNPRAAVMENGGGTTPPGGPGTVVSRLTEIWQPLLNNAAISEDQDYFDLGGDSSLAVQMFAQIERVFGVKLPLATLYEAPTIAQLAEILRNQTSESRWSPLVAIQPNGTRPPLFCFHGAGGNVLSYRELSVYLGSDQPVYGLQCQGLDGDSPLLTKIEDMAALYVKAIRNTQPKGPYFLTGYCMGGTLAYEAAQQLRGQGEEIGFVALLDTMNWHKIPLNFWTKSSYWLQRLWFHAASFRHLDSKGKKEFLEEKVAALRNRIPVWKGMLAARLGHKTTGHADAQLLAEVWKTNDKASWAYVPQPFDGCITDIRPTKQYSVFSGPELKWDQLARRGQETMVLPVYPATMLIEPFVRDLASAIRISMDSKILGVATCK
jgi:thioesterase domain-containing protein/acyl carrier protein